MTVTTPLGDDVLLLAGFEGEEFLSGLYHFRMDLLSPLANNSDIKYENILGKEVTIEVDIDSADGEAHRYFSGICYRFSQGNRDDLFDRFEAWIVPKFWLLTRTTRTRVYQQKSVPDILKDVMSTLDVDWQIQGTFEKREYCVQYRESDFDFACRLMEDEGIFYFFQHKKGSHKMVVGNTSQPFAAADGPTAALFETAEASESDANHVNFWTKIQEIKSGKLTLWDKNFQLPDKNLEAKKTSTTTVAAGTVTHQLKVGGNENFELYDFPGGFAKRFDGIDKSGGEQASELSKVYQDNVRTAGIRMDQEAAGAITVTGKSNCNYFTTGYKFTLDQHPDGNGDYLLTHIKHEAKTGTAYRSGETSDFQYHNEFTCLPFAVTYRPERKTPKPTVKGVETAKVVGPSGQEIFTDKYGRVKVQFPWDREGQEDANSSCWLRVTTMWAGKQWGSMFIPRIGQEVIVDFMEGDPDCPIIVGSVYNPSQMPPYTLPDNKTRSGIKSRSADQGGPDNYNEIRFEDKKGSEQIFINAEMDMDLRVEKESREFVGANQHIVVTTDRKEKVGGNHHVEVTSNHNEKIGQQLSLNVGTNRAVKVGQNDAVDAGMAVHIKAGTTVVIEAGAQLSLKVGGNFIDISSAGVVIQGSMVMINSGGAAGSGAGASPTAPEKPDTADDGTKGTKLE